MDRRQDLNRARPAFPPNSLHGLCSLPCNSTPPGSTSPQCHGRRGRGRVSIHNYKLMHGIVLVQDLVATAILHLQQLQRPHPRTVPCEIPSVLRRLRSYSVYSPSLALMRPWPSGVSLTIAPWSQYSLPLAAARLHSTATVSG